MDGQQFCLKWDGFQGSVTSVFDHLRRDSELVDVTLCCEGQWVQAHRMMLSACSPYFRELFKGLPYQQLAVFLKDTSAADLTAIVEFMYKGSVNVAQSQLASFIKTAEMLQVRGLSGDDDKPAPPSRQTAPPARQTAPPSRQAAPPSPIPRRPPEPPLPPPPPPPSASPPPKRRRASEPLPSPDGNSPAASPGRPGTPAGSPRPASLPSPVPVTPLSARRPPSSPRETAQQQQQSQQQHQQHQQQQEHHPQQQQQRNQEQAQQQQRQHQQQLPGQNQHHQRQQQQQQYHQEQHHQGHQQQGLHAPLSEEMVKVEKLDLTDDEVSLEDTLDHVAELERYGAGEAAVGGQDQLQQQLHQQQQRMNLAAAAAAAQQLGAVPGPSQRLSEDGTSQGVAARFACTICGQCYTNPDSRQMHMKKHSGETTCPVCGKVYSMVHNLRRHMRTAHEAHYRADQVRAMLGAPQGHLVP